jgi:hypothetical protein
MEKPDVRVLFFLLLVLALPLQADILANGSFADGTAHWRGDAHESTSGGIIIQLDPVKWTSVSQTFNTQEPNLDFAVTFQTSDDYASKVGSLLSQSAIANLTGILYKKAIGVGPNSWLVMIVDPAAREMHYGRVPVKPGEAHPQTQNGPMANLVAHEEKTLYLAFPPGAGSITLLHVELTPHGTASGG